MKIKNKGIVKIQECIIVNIRVEQEVSPFNSIDPEIILYPYETQNLTEDQILTLAWIKFKPQAIQMFKRAIEGLDGVEYQEETEVYEGFVYSEKTPDQQPESEVDPNVLLYPSPLEIQKAEQTIWLIDQLIELEVI